MPVARQQWKGGGTLKHAYPTRGAAPPPLLPPRGIKRRPAHTRDFGIWRTNLRWKNAPQPSCKLADTPRLHHVRRMPPELNAWAGLIRGEARSSAGRPALLRPATAATRHPCSKATNARSAQPIALRRRAARLTWRAPSSGMAARSPPSNMCLTSHNWRDPCYQNERARHAPDNIDIRACIGVRRVTTWGDVAAPSVMHSRNTCPHKRSRDPFRARPQLLRLRPNGLSRSVGRISW
jgi:hypothetical protein